MSVTSGKKDLEGRFKDSKRVFEELHCVFLDREQKQYRDDWNFDPTGDQEVMNLDEEKMMNHILNCQGALAVKQQLRVAKGIQLKLTANGDALTAEQQAARNKVFKAAVSSMSDGLTHDGAAEPVHTTAVSQLSMMFPEDWYSIYPKDWRESHGWLPLKWAAVAAVNSQLGVTAADVETVYSIDPQELHLFAENGPVEALEDLLDACPEVPAATMSTESKENLLHCVARVAMEDQVAKVRLLCARYPAMMRQQNDKGRTPLHIACNHSDLVLALCEAGGRDAASAPVTHPTDPNPNYSQNGWLPLHLMCSDGKSCWEPQRELHGNGSHTTGGSVRRVLRPKDPPVSPHSDAFRLLLRLYPEAAGIEAGRGFCKKTPYQLAVDNRFHAYYRRLLLRAAPHLDPAKLRELNWEERRTAMYVAYKATFPRGTKPALLACFRLENPDVLKHVVSFL